MKINIEEIKNALEQIEVSRSIDKDTFLHLLKEACVKGYKKELGGDDAVVDINIDLEKGTLEMGQIKDVVDEVEDDFLEISCEDANELDKTKTYKAGDKFYIPADVEKMRKAIVLYIKSSLKQKISETERNNLLEAFKDKIGTMVTGVVERVDDNKGLDVNIGRTNVFLPKSQMIKDEKFYPRDPIKLFVSDVSMTSKGAKINVSRSNEGFLGALFNEEIHEIYDGTIKIKAIARRAGERSKVAVYSLEKNVDAAGACIGPNGARIQRIVSQLGNGASKEKIDIIDYSPNLALYVMDSLKPALVLGIKMDKDENDKTKAIVVVKDDVLSTAIGRKGINVHLACKLTGVNIEVMSETDALAKNIEYQSFMEVQALDSEQRAKEAIKEEKKNEVLPSLPEGYVAPLERVYAEEENNDIDESLLEQSEKEEERIEETPIETILKEENEVELKLNKEEEKQEVKTTTTLEDLEKSLEEDDSHSKNKQSSKNKKTNKEEHQKQDKNEPKYADTSKYMSIYTDEELAELDEEEYEEEAYDDEEDIDYDEYDQYYDDDDK